MLALTKKKALSIFRLISLCLALFLILTPALPVLGFYLPEPSAAFYVNDTANLMAKENEDYIIGTCEDLYEKTKAQIVVVTIKSLEDTSIEEYSTELFRKYGIGDAKKNNGVLILLSLDDRECRIEVGYGLEGAINDSKAGRIMDQYMIPYFSKNQWDEGLINGFDAITDEICKEYNVEVAHNAAAIPSDTTTNQDSSDLWGIYLIAAVAGLVGGLFMGSAFPGKAMIPGSIYLIIGIFMIMKIFPSGTKFLSVFALFIAYILGWGITSPDVDGGSGGSSRIYPSTHSYSSSGSRSYHSGGGGRSGGGGASRKF